MFLAEVTHSQGALAWATLLIGQAVIVAVAYLSNRKTRRESAEKADQISIQTAGTDDVMLVRNDIKMLTDAYKATQKADSEWKAVVNYRLDQLESHSQQTADDLRKLYAITGAAKFANRRD